MTVMREQMTIRRDNGTANGGDGLNNKHGAVAVVKVLNEIETKALHSERQAAG